MKYYYLDYDYRMETSRQWFYSHLRRRNATVENIVSNGVIVAKVLKYD